MKTASASKLELVAKAFKQAIRAPQPPAKNKTLVFLHSKQKLSYLMLQVA